MSKTEQGIHIIIGWVQYFTQMRKVTSQKTAYIRDFLNYNNLILQEFKYKHVS